MFLSVIIMIKDKFCRSFRWADIFAPHCNPQKPLDTPIELQNLND
jgi:hypothetical protein